MLRRPIESTVIFGFGLSRQNNTEPHTLNMNARNIWIAVIVVSCALLLLSGPDYFHVRSPVLFAIVLVIVSIASVLLPKQKRK